MLRAVLPRAWLRLAPLALLPGCLVSFNDYPLGDTSAMGSGGESNTTPSAGKAGMASGGSQTGGSSSSSAGRGGMASLEAPATMIDDFEDGNSAIMPLQGRSGMWYAANDGKGMQMPANNMAVVPTPTMPARPGSARAVHTVGGPFLTWGALIGTSLASVGDQGTTYDLSGYNGLHLWVRLGSPNAGAKSVRLNFPTPGTNSGGGCIMCNDHFGVDIPLTSEWVQIEVPWSALHQKGFGVPKIDRPDLEHVTSLQLAFPVEVSFDLWVDDIQLY